MLGVKPLYIPVPAVLFFHVTFSFLVQEYVVGFDLKALNMYKQCMDGHTKTVTSLFC